MFAPEDVAMLGRWAIVGMVVGSCQAAAAMTIHTFPGSVWQADASAMDAALGLSGYQIEGFEDLQLTSGLTYELVDPDVGPSAVLPNLYDPTVQWTNNTWDGTHAFTITPPNKNWNPGLIPDLARVVTFRVEGGARSFGIGTANFQSIANADTTLVVNGVSYGRVQDMAHYADGTNVRNLYLRIDGSLDNLIESVSFVQNARGKDGLVFDHLAFKPRRLPGDYDDDGDVDAGDYQAWRANFGTSGSFPAIGINADGNRDGIVNLADYTVWRNNFGATDAAATSTAVRVPEPLALGLLGTMAVAASRVVRLAARCRRAT